MGPQNAVTLPANRVVARKTLLRIREVESPRLSAYDWPIKNTFKSLMLRMEISSPAKHNAAMMTNRRPVTLLKLPIVHNTYCFNAGASDKYCNRLMRADPARTNHNAQNEQSHIAF